MTTVDQFAQLHTPAGRAALSAATELAGLDPLAAASALRARGVTADLAATALTQVDLRRRAAAKFGREAARMFFTRTGLEQATRGPVARRRAARIAASGATRLLDLGCGIGSDAIAAARAGLTVLAVEQDPLTAAVARANAQVLGLSDRLEVRDGDATEVDLAGWDAVFCDPARRRDGTGRRVFDSAGYRPPWDFVTALPARIPRTVLKLAPGIEHRLLPAGAEAQWVSVGGDVVEAAVWCGPLARVPRRATLLRPATAPSTGPVPGPNRPGGAGNGSGPAWLPPVGGYNPAGLPVAGYDPAGLPVAGYDPARRSVDGYDPDGLPADGRACTGPGPVGAAGSLAGATVLEADPTTAPATAVELTGAGTRTAPVGPVGRFLYDPDGAVVRSHLVAELADQVGGRLADPSIAYVYTDHAVDTPFARRLVVEEVLPFSLRRLREAVRARGAGRLEICKRGSAIDVQQLRRDLRPAGENSLTIVLTRLAGAPTALLCAAPAPPRPGAGGGAPPGR